VNIRHTSFGVLTPEHDHAVFNERSVRAAAGLLFVFGFGGWMKAALTSDFLLLRAFLGVFYV